MTPSKVFYKVRQTSVSKAGRMTVADLKKALDLDEKNAQSKDDLQKALIDLELANAKTAEVDKIAAAHTAIAAWHNDVLHAFNVKHNKLPSANLQDIVDAEMGDA